MRVRCSQDRRYEARRLLRGEEPAAGEAVRVPLVLFDDRYYVRGPKATTVGKESGCTAVSVFHRPAGGIHLCQSHTSSAGARSLWSTAADDRSDPPNPDDDRSSEWSKVAQELRIGCVLSPLLVNVFFAVVLLVALERFSKDADILAGIIHLQEQPPNVSRHWNVCGVLCGG